MLSLYAFSAYLSSPTLARTHPRRPQESSSRKTIEDEGSVLGRYDAHVQPVQPVYRWEKPGQTPNGYAHQPVRARPVRTAAAEPRYTIDLQGI
jgi:hypothetical protein